MFVDRQPLQIFQLLCSDPEDAKKRLRCARGSATVPFLDPYLLLQAIWGTHVNPFELSRNFRLEIL